MSLLAQLAAVGGLRAGDDGPVVERGTFVLHLYMNPHLFAAEFLFWGAVIADRGFLPFTVRAPYPQ